VRSVLPVPRYVYPIGALRVEAGMADVDVDVDVDVEWRAAPGPLSEN
jgi:hypothetical protein